MLDVRLHCIVGVDDAWQVQYLLLNPSQLAVDGLPGKTQAVVHGELSTDALLLGKIFGLQESDWERPELSFQNFVQHLHTWSKKRVDPKGGCQGKINRHVNRRHWA